VNFIGALPNVFFGLFFLCAILMNWPGLGNSRALELPQRQPGFGGEGPEERRMRVGIDAGLAHHDQQLRGLPHRTAHRAHRRAPLLEPGAAVSMLQRVAVAFRRAGTPRNIIVRAEDGAPSPLGVGDVRGAFHVRILHPVERA
jgi:hypothetical protein